MLSENIDAFIEHFDRSSVTKAEGVTYSSPS
jgi:hypothetical protein